MPSIGDLFQTPIDQTGDPMTDPMQVRAPVLPAQAPAPPRALDMFSRLFGGQPGLNEQFGPDAISAASRAGRLRAGLALLAAGDRNSGVGLGTALQQGLAAGQQGFQGALQQTAAIQQQQRRQQLFGALQAQPGDTNETIAARLEKLLPQALATDPETAKTMVAYLSHLKSMKGEWQVANLGAAGAYFVNPTTQQVQKIADGAQRVVAPEKTTNVLGADGKPYTVYSDRDGNELFRLPQVGKTTGEMTAGQQGSEADRLIKRYDNLTALHAKAADAFHNVQEVAQRAAMGGSLPGDITTVIDGISRLQNPGAVVRVGTMNIQLDKIGSWPEKFKRMVSQAQAGNWPPELVAGIAEAARGIAKTHYNAENTIRKSILGTAKRRGIDVTEEDLMPHFNESDFAGAPAQPTPAPTPGGAPPRLPGESPAAYLKRTGGQ